VCVATTALTDLQCQRKNCDRKNLALSDSSSTYVKRMMMMVVMMMMIIMQYPLILYSSIRDVSSKIFHELK
jgi:hypothetical protein